MRVLLFYITKESGHHHASTAVEQALKQIAPSVHVKQVDAFTYTNPVLARIINQTYMGVLKTRPELWEYLYDNPKLIRRIRSLRDVIHRYNSAKFKALMEAARPDVVACTQAFPCGMVADFKATYRPHIPLVAVLTDYAPHSYWVFDEVDAYVVASATARDRLMAHGVAEDRIKMFGIPIDPHFGQPMPANPRDAAQPPLILLMGGSTGFGPLREMVQTLERCAAPFRLHVIAGHNRALYRWCMKRRGALEHQLTVSAHEDQVWSLMRRAALLITKPGGLTTAEALAVGLPMIMINPIPGQEAQNAEYVLRHAAAVRARDADEVALLAEELLRNSGKRQHMRQAALQASHPHAAANTARFLLELHQPSAVSAWLSPTARTVLVNSSR